MTKKADLLRLNLQYFAEEPDKKEEPPVEPETPTVEGPEPKPEGKTFTQAELDKIIADRLAREQKKRDEAIQKERDEAERKRLEEDKQYKELADKYKAELEAQKADVLSAKKESLLAKAGYSEEQVAKYTKYLDGETDEALKESLDSLKADIPPKPKYVDPSVGNGGKEKPTPSDLGDEGKTLYQRLKAKGKIK